MESIEQLRIENEKLNARLNKAVQVFKDQKSQIESLTTELDNYKKSADESSYIYVDLKNRLAEVETTAQSLEELKENHIKEIQGLNEQIDKSDKEIHNLGNLLDAKQIYYDDLQADYDKLNQKYEALYKSFQITKNLHDDDLKRYNELENNYEKLQNIRNKEVSEIENIQLNITKLQKDHDDAVKTATAYQESYKEVKDQNVVLQEKLDKMNEEVQALEKTNKEYKNELDKYTVQTKNKDDAYEELRKKYNDKMTSIFEIVNQITSLNDETHQLVNKLKQIKNPPKQTQQKAISNNLVDTEEYFVI